MPPHLLEVRPVAPGVFALAGEFDIETIDDFEGWSERFTESPGDVTLELADVTFLDSTGVRAFIGLARLLEGRSILLRGATANVKRTLAISGIDGHEGIMVVPGPE